MNDLDILRMASAGESYALEFKSDHRHRLSDRDIVEAVVCLCNGSGGVLLIGVEDDGEITGAQHRHDGKTDPLRLQAYVSNKTVPPVAVTVDVILIGAAEVVAISVPDVQTIVGTSSGLYVRRATRMDGGPECIPFPAHEMLSSRIERGEVDYAAIPEPAARMSDLDPGEFDRFRRLVARSSASHDHVLAGLSDMEIGRALQVITMDRDEPALTRGALLLFGRPDALHAYVPTHETAFQVLKGQAVAINEFATEPLLKTAETLYARVQSQNTETELNVGVMRIAIPRIPPAATRELIANALVHRDFTRIGPIRVAINEDVIEVVSPGGFPRGVTLENFLSATQPRSRLLADAFMRAGLVERTGRGINRVYESVLRTGREAPDYSRTSEDHVAVTVAIADSNLNLVRFLLEHEESMGKTFALADLQVLHALRTEPRISGPDLARVLQKSDLQTKATLTRMIESGFVEARGDGRARRYSLAAATYRSLVNPTAYVRVQPFDDIQREQMVMTYVESHGQITRRDVAELCGVTPGQARKLLKELTSAGKLVLRGERRGAHYVHS